MRLRIFISSLPHARAARERISRPRSARLVHREGEVALSVAGLDGLAHLRPCEPKSSLPETPERPAGIAACRGIRGAANAPTGGMS